MADPKPEQKPKTKKAAGLRVRALAEGFRRAGRAWSVTDQDVLVSEFDKEQIAALRAEKALVVIDIEIDVAAE